MTDITANEYRTAAKVDRFHGGQSAAQFYEDNTRALESEDLVTQVAMQFAGSTWGGRDAEEQFALAGSERALAYLVGAGRLIPVGGMALTAEQVEDVRTVANCALQYGNIASREAADRLDYSLSATEPAEDGWGDVNPNDPQGRTYRETAEEYYSAPAEPAEEETRAECVGDDYYCAQRDSAGNIRLNCGRGLLVAEAACTVNDVKEWWARADRGSKWERQYQAALDLFDREAASSPVVPAPTETGPWQTWDAVPIGQTVRAANGERFRKKGVGAIHLLTNGDGDCCQVDTVNHPLPAPFTAVEDQP